MIDGLSPEFDEARASGELSGFLSTRRASHRSLGDALSRKLAQALPRFE
jgi:hypothetical protein